MIDIETLAKIWETAEKSRTAETPCAWPSCEKTVHDGPLLRVNPKGEVGIWMCRPHANIYRSEEFAT